MEKIEPMKCMTHCSTPPVDRTQRTVDMEIVPFYADYEPGLTVTEHWVWNHFEPIEDEL